MRWRMGPARCAAGAGARTVERGARPRKVESGEATSHVRDERALNYRSPLVAFSHMCTLGSRLPSRSAMREEGPELVVFAGTGQARIIRASGVWVWGLAAHNTYVRVNDLLSNDT